MNTAILNIERADAAWETQRVMTVLDARLTEAPKLKIAAYARVSSDSADQQGSYISQVRYYTQIIREKDGWEYVDIYAEACDIIEPIRKTVFYQRFQRIGSFH